jgi:hypothetical protein
MGNLEVTYLVPRHTWFRVMSPQLRAVIYYTGRLLQGLAMWILLMDVFVLAGPMGPPPNPFYLGVAMFIAGWAMVRTQGSKQ